MGNTPSKKRGDGRQPEKTSLFRREECSGVTVPEKTVLFRQDESSGVREPEKTVLFQRQECSGVREPEKTVLFRQEESSGVTYRIPALVYLEETQSFLAFAEQRSSPADRDAKTLVMRRGTTTQDGGLQWSAVEEVWSAGLPPHRSMNPCPVYERKTSTLFLFFICVLGDTPERRQIITGRNRTRLCCVTSADGGRTWSPARDLTDSVIGKSIRRWATFGVGPGHGVQLASGRMVVPAYAYYIPLRCFSFPLPCTVSPRALALYSDDHGITWHLGDMLRKTTGECQMAEIMDQEGRSLLYCNARSSSRGRCRVEALSASSGAAWDKPRPSTRLPEPRHGCQGSVIAFPAPHDHIVPDDLILDDPLAGNAASASTTTTALSPDTHTWLLFSHPTDRRRRRDVGVYLSRGPLRCAGWSAPWVLHSGPGGYSDLAACHRRGDHDPERRFACHHHDDPERRFACLLECGEESELETIAFVTFTLRLGQF